MKRFAAVFVLCFLLSVFFSQSVTHAGSQLTEFPLTKIEIISAYNDLSEALGKVRLLERSKKSEKEVAPGIVMSSYLFKQDNFGVFLQSAAGSKKPTHVFALGREDGSPEEHALVVLNAITLLAVVTPEWTGNERGEVSEALGITGIIPDQGTQKALTHRGLHFTFANNGDQGLTLIIAPAVAPTPATATVEPDTAPAFIPGKPLPYAVYESKKDVRHTIKRTRYNLRIVLATHNEKGEIIERTKQDDLTSGQFAATVIAAAKQCVKHTGADFVGVVLESQFLPGYNTSTQLAVVDYAPDGKGASGKDNMKWGIQAVEHGLTVQQLTMQRLWSGNRSRGSRKTLKKHL